MGHVTRRSVREVNFDSNISRGRDHLEDLGLDDLNAIPCLLNTVHLIILTILV
jgi:hypothetical protein